MNVLKSWWKRTIVGPVALSLVFSLTAPLCGAENTPLPSAPLPAGASGAPPQNAAPSTNPPPPPQQNAAPGQNSTSPQQPLGTAAAPAITPGGVPASRPAGAAIAPAKQRRVRILAIRVGLVVGAAIALGTVIGATKASPSRP